MQALLDASRLSQIRSDAVQALMRARLIEFGQDDPDPLHSLGPFGLIEPGDRLDQVQALFGLNLHEPGEVECLIEHDPCWELVCGLEDSGRGCLLFILKGAHTDPVLAQLGRI